ncbi:MAG: 2-dehydropantoate 2-reductase [Anaerolineales bacterium]|nr:2-dehydropantoate 2-reductase [Anaerolineales bacterium]
MQIAVYGTGGVGGYFGGRLAQAGEDVTFIARGEHLKRIQTTGLRVESIKGDFCISPAQATDDPAAIGEVDVVLVCVKAWQVNEAAQAMRPLVGEKTIFIPLQNGVDAPNQLGAELGDENVLGGYCQISAFIAEPGLIRHVGVEPYIAFARLDGKATPLAEQLLRAFQKVNVKAEIPQDIQAAMWEKFIFIAAVSGVGSIARQSIGVVRDLPGTRRMLEQVMQEIVTVAAAKGIVLPKDVISRKMDFVDSMPMEGIPSMQRDIMAGKPSELEAQNGAVVRMGIESSTPTPVNAFIYYSLLPQENVARGL